MVTVKLFGTLRLETGVKELTAEAVHLPAAPKARRPANGW